MTLRVRGPGSLAGSRWLGLAGTVLLAAAAYAWGALPGTPPSSDRLPPLATIGEHPRVLVGLAAWLVGLTVLVVAWQAARRHSPSTRWVLVTGALWALPLLVAPPLGSRDAYAYACQGAMQHAGLDPYAHGVSALPCQWLSAVPAAWRDTATPYGPFWLAISDGAAAASGGHLVVALALLRAVALVGVALAAWGIVRLAPALGVAPGAALLLGAANPVVLLHAVSGAHNDALIAGLIVAAFALAVRPPPLPWWGNAVLVGALSGLAFAVKATALVAIPFAILLVARAGTRRRLAAATAVCGTGLAAALLVLRLATGRGFGWVHALSGSASLVQWVSPPTGVGMTLGYALRALGQRHLADLAVPAARIVALVLLAVVLVALWLYARARAAQPGTVVAAAGTALAAAVVLSPVVYPWYAIVPLAVLACCVPAESATARWLGYAAVVVAYLVLPSGLGVASLTKGPGAVLMTALVVVAVVVVARRRARVPSRPPAGGSS